MAGQSSYSRLDLDRMAKRMVKDHDARHLEEHDKMQHWEIRCTVDDKGFESTSLVVYMITEAGLINETMRL